MSSSPEAARDHRRTQETMALLFVGYAGYYFCRTFFASIKPILIAQYGAYGINKETLGIIATVGTLTYAVGKVGNTIVCDFVGGRRVFLFGMVGSAATTLLFGASAGFAWFLALWAMNRLIQSMGWGGLVKIASNWFAYTHYGRVMAVLSLTFVLGDVVSKLFYGMMLEHGASWQAVCVAGSVVLGCVALALTIRLKETPREVGLPEPPANPANVFGSEGSDSRNAGVMALLKPFLRSPSFWVVLALSFGLTMVRDTFGEWLPLYLAEVGGLSPGSASMWASLFPFLGAVSILSVGWYSDRFLNRRRGGIMALLLILAVAILFIMSRLEEGQGAGLPVALAAATALLTVGPYSFLAGAIALDLGARRGSATASGMVDGVGYLSGFVSGAGIGSIAERAGWGSAFGVLGVACAVTAMAAVAYWLRYEPGRC